ncbi:tyrosine-protein kinase domain-containing protein [Lentimicrobium sp.]
MDKTEEIFQQKTNYKDLIFKMWRYKWWFVLTTIVFVGGAYLFNKLSTARYRNQTTLLLKESERNNFLSSQNVMQGFGLFSNNDNIENELGILTSYSLINEVVNKLNMEIAFFKEEYRFGGIIKKDFLLETQEEYLYQPLRISINKSIPQAIDVKIYYTILNENEFMLEAIGKEVLIYDYLTDEVISVEDNFHFKGKYKFGETVNEKFFNVTIHLNEEVNKGTPMEGGRHYFTLNSPSFLTLKAIENIKAYQPSITSSLVIITMSGDNRIKITDFLNALSSTYLDNNLEKKNKIAINTVKFIDSQISDVADSLNFAESKLQNFRTSNRVTDLGYQGQQSLERLSRIEGERAMLTMQKKYYDYIRDYFSQNTDLSDLIAPSSMNVQDPLLNQLITQLITLNSERNNLLNQGNVKNLRLGPIEVQIANLKQTIMENIKSNAATTEIALQDLNNRSARISSEMSRLPSTERQLFGIERTFKLNDAIYTFLMQKRSEAQIASASNTPDYEVVDPARLITAYKIFPKSNLTLTIGLMLGLIIPFIVIVLKDFLNTRIVNKKEVTQLTNFPILGHVFHNDTKDKIVISENVNSPLSETFRSLRTNLQFYAKDKDKQFFLVTSSYSGEGKSFISQNLALVYALFGKKTLLVGFDLRRPKLYHEFNLSNNKGITSYLIGQASLDEIIQHTSNVNLDFISAGPIPPNPLELIASDATKTMINALKERYEYIIIDSPPIGVVSDAFLLTEFADVNIYIVRQGYTNKDAFANNIKQMQHKNIKHVSIVINDVTPQDMRYDYGYDYSYYKEDDKKKFLFGWFTSKGKRKSIK